MFLKKSHNNLPPNQHVCLISDSILSINQTVTHFILQGVFNNRKILYLFSSQCVQRSLPDVYPGSKFKGNDNINDSFQFIEFENHLENERIVVDSVTDHLSKSFEKAMATGFNGIVLINEMSFSSKWIQGVAALEAKINTELLACFPCSVLCIYNPKMHYAKTIKDVIDSHPLVLNEGSSYSKII